MLNIGIVTDALSNLPSDIAEKYNIYVVPGLIYINNQKFISGTEISTKEILNYLDKKTIKTSVPPPGDYFNLYEQVLDQYDFIISLHCPTKQTAFFKSAVIGAKRTRNPEKIKLIECGVATLGLGLVAIATSIYAKQTSDIDTLLQKVTEFCQKVEVLGAVNSFDYIKRSGRIKLKVAGTVASLLAMKPVLAMHGQNIYLLEKTRNRQKSLKKLFEHFEKRIDDTYDLKMIGISHLMGSEELNNLKQSVLKRFPTYEIIATEVGPMIASNTGPGLILITYFGKVVS